MQRAFNGLGQMVREWQSHSGAVNTSTTPSVQYAYSEMASGANHSRLTSITYPSGYVLTYNYASGINDDVSRLSSLSDSTGTLEAYSYLGLGTVVVRAHPQPGVDLSYVKLSAESVGDAGDQYTGLDRFGRVVDQRWLDSSTGTATDRFVYGYDAAGNRTYRDNLVNTAFGEVYTYDALDQLASFARGTLNGTRTGVTGTAARTQDWDYDALGNFDSVSTDGTAQARTANAQNEITSIAGATTPTYDSNGNMTGDETGRQFVYDAWNRLVAVKNSGGTTLKTYEYDGLNRRVSETVVATSVTTDLFYSDQWQVLAEKVGASYTQRYVWSPVYVDAMVLRDRDTDANGTLDERLWVQQDANWNVTALVNGSGAMVGRYAYDPYGVRTVLDANWAVDTDGLSDVDFWHGFQGLLFDATAGLNRTHTRPYSPTLARFTGPDWIGFDGGDANLYRFVGNGPTNYLDPNGTEKEAGVDWTERLDVVGKLGISRARTANRLFQEGRDAAMKKFTPAEVNDGRGDAWRHAYIACKLRQHPDFQPFTEKPGGYFSHYPPVTYYPAYWILLLHEQANERTGQPQIEYAMDMHNNSVGLSLGADPCADCAKEADKALADGRLIWMEIVDRTPLGDGRFKVTHRLTNSTGGPAQARYYGSIREYVGTTPRMQVTDSSGNVTGTYENGRYYPATSTSK